jgi:hypothetical protein
MSDKPMKSPLFSFSFCRFFYGRVRQFPIGPKGLKNNNGQLPVLLIRQSHVSGDEGRATHV